MNPTYEDLQHRLTEQDGIICKLQQMNRNTAEQAVAGYKEELASALKSIVEDAQLPEARTDPDIATALLWDMLDVLRYKGVIQTQKMPPLRGGGKRDDMRMNLFKCETVAQFKIGMWLVEHGIERDDIASTELLALDTVKITNPVGGYMVIRWRDGEAEII